MTAKILEGNVLETLKDVPACSVQCAVTSPPYYGLRDYGVEGQIGLEATPELYVENLVAVFREVRRVLKDDGTLWLNLGDSYAGSWGNYGGQNRGKGKQREITNGSQVEQKAYEGKEHWKPPTANNLGNGIKPKDLIGIPWMVAFALRADGWYLRSEIIWAKPNPMPESVKDRPTKSHEQIFLFSKSPDYFYDYEAILEIATGYDGRKDTMMKGSKKYKDGEYLANGNANSLSVKGRERWKNTMPKNLQADGQQPNTMHKNRAKGLGEPQGYGLSGKGFKGHSGNLDSEGNPLGHDIDGVPARNKRDVWFVSTKPYKEAHFATFPVDLIEPCILAGSKEGDTVLDPFNGSGTTGEVSIKHHRLYIGCELNPKYVKLTHRRLSQVQPVLMQGRSLTNA